MRLTLVAALLLAIPASSGQQAASILRVRVALRDASQALVPVARHLLLVSDNPATREPRRLMTGADGTATVTLPPGSYTVESDRPVPFLGSAYQWTQMIDLPAGREAVLELTNENAETVSMPADAAAPRVEPLSLLTKWQPSLVAIWSPTGRATGFVVDARGLIATDQAAIGRATQVAVQLSPVRKVTGRVLVSDADRGVAFVHVNPEIVANVPPVPVCAGAAPPFDDGQDVVALTMPLRGPIDAVDGEVTTLGARAVETDLRLTFGGAGGPALNADGVVIGMTSLPPVVDPRRVRDPIIIRMPVFCDALAAARDAVVAAIAPEASELPVEPATPANAAPVKASSTPPPVIPSSEFEVTLITPPAVQRGLDRAEWTGGAGGRTPEAEARLGRITDFGTWSDYFADNPRVLIVRVTPKLVEGFWRRLAREAARTQGAELPPLKAFAGSFARLTLTCGARPVAPIHPFVLEHRLPDSATLREGLYVFDPATITPQCGEVTLLIYADKEPQRPSTLTIPPEILAQLHKDFPD